MRAGVPVSRCRSCGTGYFPSRLICRNCQKADWSEDRVCEGFIEEITIVRHSMGTANWKPKIIASVKTSEAQLIVASLEENVEPGSTVMLFEQDGAVFAKK